MFKRLKEKLRRKWEEFLKQGRVPTTYRWKASLFHWTFYDGGTYFGKIANDAEIK